MKLFQKKGYVVYACANSSDQKEKKYLEQQGIVCIDISFERNPLSLKNVKAYKELKKLKENIHFDLIHTHTPVASFLTRKVYANTQDTSVIYTAHGFHFYKGASKLSWLLYFNLEKIAMKWTDHIITINKEDFANAKLLGYTDEQISYVHGVGVDSSYNRLNLTQRNSLKKELSIDENEIVVSYVAELNKNKNQMFLLQNWGEIKKAIPNAKLLFIGTGNSTDLYMNYVKKRGLQGIVFTGYRQDVMDILQITDIITLLSVREGLGKCLLEGMVVKLPCIVTDSRGPRDLVQDNFNGYIIQNNDQDDLVEKFIKLLKDESLREEMGNKSYELVQSYFLENVINEYDNIYGKYL